MKLVSRFLCGAIFLTVGPADSVNADSNIASPPAITIPPAIADGGMSVSPTQYPMCKLLEVGEAEPSDQYPLSVLGAGSVATGTTSYLGSNDDSQEVAKRLIAQKIITLALKAVYAKTGSSNGAAETVSDVLQKHGCNGDVVKSIPFSEWGPNATSGVDIAQPFNITEALANSALLQFFPMPTRPDVNESISHPQVPIFDYASALLQSFPDTSLDRSGGIEPPPQADRFAALGYTGHCGTVLHVAQEVCSGTLTPEMVFAQQHPKDMTHAQAGPVLQQVILPIVLALAANYTSARIEEYRKKSAQISKLQSEINKTKTDLKNQNDIVKSTIENEAALQDRLTTDSEDKTISDADFSKEKSDATAQAASMKSNHDSAEKAAERDQKTIDDDEQKIDDLRGGVGDEDKTPPEDGLDAYTAFLTNVWGPTILALDGSARECTGQLKPYSSPKPGLTLPPKNPTNLIRSPLTGSCQFDDAMDDLHKSIGDSGNLGLTIGTELIGRPRGSGRAVGLPNCNPYGSADCLPTMNKYYRQLGYDGGMAEACQVDPTESGCAAYLQLKTVGEDSQIGGVIAPPTP